MSTPTNILITTSHDAPRDYRARIGNGETYRHYIVTADSYGAALTLFLAAWKDSEREAKDVADANLV